MATIAGPGAQPGNARLARAAHSRGSASLPPPPPVQRLLGMVDVRCLQTLNRNAICTSSAARQQRLLGADSLLHGVSPIPVTCKVLIACRRVDSGRSMSFKVQHWKYLLCEPQAVSLCCKTNEARI